MKRRQSLYTFLLRTRASRFPVVAHANAPMRLETNRLCHMLEARGDRYPMPHTAHATRLMLSWSQPDVQILISQYTRALRECMTHNDLRRLKTVE